MQHSHSSDSVQYDYTLALPKANNFQHINEKIQAFVIMILLYIYPNLIGKESLSLLAFWLCIYIYIYIYI